MRHSLGRMDLETELSSKLKSHILHQREVKGSQIHAPCRYSRPSKNSGPDPLDPFELVNLIRLAKPLYNKHLNHLIRGVGR